MVRLIIRAVPNIKNARTTNILERSYFKRNTNEISTKQYKKNELMVLRISFSFLGILSLYSALK
jgi:hypothetical protein